MAAGGLARHAAPRRLAATLLGFSVLLSFDVALGSQLRPPGIRRAQFAVVRPFWAGELADLSSAEAAPPPCLGGPLPVDLVLYFAGRPTDTVETDVAAWPAADALEEIARRRVAGTECFQNVHIEYSDAAADEKYPTSACRQFVDMYSGNSPLWGYHSIYYMELDVTPIRAGWLEEILPALREVGGGVSWVVGATADESCMQAGPAVNVSFHSSQHINGNAIYSSAAAYVQRVQAHSPKCDLPWDQGASFDSAMWEAAAADDSARAKWRDDPVFKNCKPSGDHHDAGYERTVGRKKLEREFPDAVLVHSTYPTLVVR